MIKTFIVFACLLLLLTSCHHAYFSNPNDLRNIQGKLFLVDGKVLEGNLQISKESVISAPVKIFADGDRKPMHFKLRDIKGYLLHNDYYALKQISGLFGKPEFSFMKRLTSENSKVHLYEHIKKSNSSFKGSLTVYEKEYFMDLQHQNNLLVWSVSSSGLAQEFREKMNILLNNCPALAEKIITQEEGYNFKRSYNTQKAEILLKIIEEYNECK